MTKVKSSTPRSKKVSASGPLDSKPIKKVAQSKKKKHSKKSIMDSVSLSLGDGGLLFLAEDGVLSLVEMDWITLLQQIKDENIKRLFGSDEARKIKKFYRKLTSKMNIACNCGNTIPGQEIANNFRDLATTIEHAFIEDDDTEVVKAKEGCFD